MCAASPPLRYSSLKEHLKISLRVKMFNDTVKKVDIFNYFIIFLGLFYKIKGQNFLDERKYGQQAYIFLIRKIFRIDV